MTLDTQPELVELKPCPFCGNDPLFEEPTPNNWHTYSVKCDHCPKPLQPLGAISESKDDAIAAWNERALPISCEDEITKQMKKTSVLDDYEPDEITVTPEMIQAGLRALVGSGLVDDLLEADSEAVAQIFRAMLRASPEPSNIE